MVLHQAGEVLHWDESGVLWVQLLLYELKQGASIHILAREVRGAAEDKGIGRRAAGWDRVLRGDSAEVAAGGA